MRRHDDMQVCSVCIDENIVEYMTHICGAERDYHAKVRGNGVHVAEGIISKGFERKVYERM